MPPKLNHYYKIFIEFPRVSFAIYAFQIIGAVVAYLLIPNHETITNTSSAIQFGLGGVVFIYAYKVLVLEIWRVRAANRWFDGNTTAGHKNIKFTQPPYTEVPFAQYFIVFVLLIIVSILLLSSA
jgi:hypothetical protein